ncbi:MAG: hypothetical protein ACM3ML_37815 [Micromonosporaceae bacterium]
MTPRPPDASTAAGGLGRSRRARSRRAWSSRARSLGARAWPALAGLVLGLLALGPALGRGFVLSYDMVFVPDPPLSAATFGLAGGPPRAIPSDPVTALIAHVIPADITQKLIIVLIFVLACSGAAALASVIPRGRPNLDQSANAGAERPDTANHSPAAPALARLAAGVFYAWNPFVAERLLIGQWAMLLGYAGLPWVLRSICTADRIRLPRLCVAIIPAVVGGFAALAISGLVAIPAAVSRGSGRMRVSRLATVLAVLGVGSLPWLIPALVISVHTDPGAVNVFAARADTPFGRLVSLLMLGGIWNAQTVPRGYGGPASVAWLMVALAGTAGYVLAARPKRLCPGLGVAAIAGLLVAAAGLTAGTRDLLATLIRAWPGFAVLRDGQRYVAPLALAQAAGLAALVTWVVRDLAARTSPARVIDTAPVATARAGPAAAAAPPAASGRGARPGPTAAARAAVALGIMAVVAPVLLVPGLALGAAGRLHAVRYPADWARARRIIDADRRPGSALVLPWAAYRRYPWNRGEAVFDPWSRLLNRRVIFNDALTVGTRTLAAEDPEARRLAPVVTSQGSLTGALAAAHVRYVIVDAGPLLAQGAGPPAARLHSARFTGASVVLASGDLLLLRLPSR